MTCGLRRDANMSRTLLAAKLESFRDCVIAHRTRRPAVAGVDCIFCDLDLTVSRIEETQKLKFRVNLGHYKRYGRLTVFKTLLERQY